jgi:hypothetical protein
MPCLVVLYDAKITFSKMPINLLLEIFLMREHVFTIVRINLQRICDQFPAVRKVCLSGPLNFDDSRWGFIFPLIIIQVFVRRAKPMLPSRYSPELPAAY